ncbi:MAG TPA: acyl-CoA dehydrogenase family protein, partial [Planctomicrobium sp.]|nr:acyl-CoA dehydrogenase family protein [Planctomicrobium sp.]
MVNSATLQTLSENAISLDETGEWPFRQFELLAQEGILRWGIPEEFGGQPILQRELLEGYEQLAAACMTTTFILTQRMGACQRIAASENQLARERLLPDLAVGRTFATVGISHLTTSRQHVKTPAVQVELQGDQISLNGMIPWVTGAPHADTIVTGGTCSDGRQVLIALPTRQAGVSVQPHARLMALTASHTATIQLQKVQLSTDDLLAGPVDSVMTTGPGSGTGSLTTSVLALGLSQRVARFIREQAKVRPDLTEVSQRFDAELISLHNDLYQSATNPEPTAQTLNSASIRQRANSLALRIS